MQHFIKITILLLVPIFFNSCFEIREEVNMDDDGTGDLKLVVNLSESKDQIKKYLDVQESGNGMLPKDKNVESILKHVQVVLESVKGFSNISIDRDYTDFVFAFNGRFENIEVVNDAVSTLTKALDYLYVPHFTEKNFQQNGNKFERFFNYPIDKEGWEELPSFAKYSLESAKITSIYRFAAPIKEFSNKKAFLSPSGKAIKLENSVAGIATGRETMANVIEF